MRVIWLMALSWIGWNLLMTSEASAARPLTIDDMFKFERLSDPQISPDGKLVAYVVSQPNLEKNNSTSTIWLVPTDGGAPRQLTTTTKHDRHPRWSPDGKQLLFESDRSGSQQLWLIDVAGGEARQLTTIATDAGTGLWSPDGKSIAFVSAVYPEYSDKPYAESNAANQKRKEEIEKNPVKARVFTKLFYRHWDSWVEDKRQHLFVIPAAGGDPRDLTPGDRDGYPTSSTFSTGDDFCFTPDGQSIVFTAPPEKDEAWSTDYNLYLVPVAGGAAKRITENPAADNGPKFSPDGKRLAYRAQTRSGFEADRWQLVVLDFPSGKPKSVTPAFDRSVEGFVWRDNDTIDFVAEQNAGSPIFRVSVKAPGAPKEITSGGTNGALSTDSQGKLLAFTRASLDRPADVFVLDTSGKAKNLTNANSKLLAELGLPQPESVSVPGDGGTPMQMWILKPPDFDPKKKWPLAYLVHGGPQGAWDNNWSYRWNAQLWAAQGYVVALPNPRGSTGFGQKYVDEISGDWGGKVYNDLMAGVDYLEKQPYIDRDRMASAGASFGGYMMNWFAGHTDRFKTLITHCGVYNFDSMYTTTEELWFDEWEHGGPPWGKHRESYEKHSPHRFAEKFKTPMLIIHNDLDFRVPVSEGLQLFTALQRQGIESKMINFPDEGHWVLKPANSAFWHKEVFAWLTKMVPPGAK